MPLNKFQAIDELQKWVNSLKQEMDRVNAELTATLQEETLLVAPSREAQARMVLRGVEQRLEEVNEMYKTLLDEIAGA